MKHAVFYRMEWTWWVPYNRGRSMSKEEADKVAHKLRLDGYSVRFDEQCSQ